MTGRIQPQRGTILTALQDFTLPGGKKFKRGEVVPRKLLTEQQIQDMWLAFYVNASYPEPAKTGA